MNNKITNTDINEFKEFLINENKSRTTLDKYMRDIRRFQIFLSDNSYPISQDTADKYIEILKNADYSISSINTIISCINTFCNFIGRNDIHCENCKLFLQLFLKYFYTYTIHKNQSIEAYFLCF